MSTILNVQELTKDYGELRAVDHLSFEVTEGEFVTVLGPSGCGKTTTLHAIAGLVEPTGGRIFLRGDDVTDLPPNARNLGMAFQSTALFPNMTVRENISYGLKMHGYDADAITARVDEFLELVDMPEHGEHRPGELSGGQQQRVSLARALAYEPDMLLLDEPLTGLDRVLREEMREWLKSIQREVGVTTLYVTHDQEDALSMSDTVIILKDGRKQQEGTPEEIYEAPANPFVAEFVGKSTKLTGTVTTAGQSTVVRRNGTEIRLPRTGYEEGKDVTLYIRPEDISLGEQAPDGTNNAFRGTVREIANLGNRAEITLELSDGTTALANATRFPEFAVGDELAVTFDSEQVIVL